jgi:hypothetical protein
MVLLRSLEKDFVWILIQQSPALAGDQLEPLLASCALGGLPHFVQMGFLEHETLATFNWALQVEALKPAVVASNGVSSLGLVHDVREVHHPAVHALLESPVHIPAVLVAEVRHESIARHKALLRRPFALQACDLHKQLANGLCYHYNNSQNDSMPSMQHLMIWYPINNDQKTIEQLNNLYITQILLSPTADHSNYFQFLHNQLSRVRKWWGLL